MGCMPTLTASFCMLGHHATSYACSMARSPCNILNPQVRGAKADGYTVVADADFGVKDDDIRRMLDVSFVSVRAVSSGYDLLGVGDLECSRKDVMDRSLPPCFFNNNLYHADENRLTHSPKGPTMHGNRNCSTSPPCLNSGFTRIITAPLPIDIGATCTASSLIAQACGQPGCLGWIILWKCLHHFSVTSKLISLFFISRFSTYSSFLSIDLTTAPLSLSIEKSDEEGFREWVRASIGETHHTSINVAKLLVNCPGI